MIFATACLLFGTFTTRGTASHATEIGIIQYNVKGGHGGWTSDNGTLEKQINLIASRVNRNRVDFVFLQQADERPGVPGPIISDRLPKGWRTLVSACNKDTTQLAFSPDWDLVNAPELKNPLLNGISPQRGWIRGGCEGGDGRPYNIALFQNTKSKLRLLAVVLHFPHCHQEFKACIAAWEVERFQKDISMVAGEDRSGMNLVAVGDMNELAEADPRLLEQVFAGFGKLQTSFPLITCCNVDGWRYKFDRILSNSRQAPNSEIIMDGVYPLNPRHGRNNAEHKAIYGTVIF